jgi:hypothetical protein
MPKHIRYECTKDHEYEYGYSDGYCMFCDGGLFSCVVCGGTEGSLPTNCPGFEMTDEQDQQVYNGKIDWRNERGWCLPDGVGNSMGDVNIKIQEIKRRRYESIRSDYDTR